MGSIASKSPERSPAPSLIDPRFDQDSCGVGFVATLRNQPSHEILSQALTALARLAHRGAIAADGKSSDGVGIMTAVPRDFFLASTVITLNPAQPLGGGVVFFPDEAGPGKQALEQALTAHNLEILTWRIVPTREDILGEIALASIPVIRQVLVTCKDPDQFDRRLYLARKQFERDADTSAYICSLSSYTLVYKAMCAGRLMAEFYPDLADPAFTTPFAIFHQRYATNVLPSWDRAQPLRTLAHNGEINTVWGNRGRMAARAATIPAECHPILSTNGSDSTSLDEVVELLARNGRSVAEAVRMLLPPAGRQKESAFLRYHADCVEPWDGPAALAFADGHLVGVALDRNGLRPCRFFLTDDALVVAGSEAGLVDLDPEKIIHSGRLGPGEMLVAGLDQHQLLEDERLLKEFDRFPRFGNLGADPPLEPAAFTPPVEDLTQLQQVFGYTREDVRMVLAPMASDGKDAVWSMGDDTPLAPLAHAPRPVYAFFRQRFAQVTNPAIDPVRESIVIELHTRLGPWPHLLNTSARIPGLSLQSPFLSLGQMHSLRNREHPLADEMPLAVLDCVFAPTCNLRRAIDDLRAKAVELVQGGAQILLLTDRALAQPSARAELLPIPMAMATGAVHHALVDAGVRTQAGLAVEAGDIRDLHHAAVILGYGAGAVCPWLALETARNLDPEKGEANMLHAFDLGLAKIMSKMGISVLDSYRSAHLFDILGLDQEVVEQCFFGTPSPISGIGFTELETALRDVWSAAQDDDPGQPALVNATHQDSQPPTATAQQPVAKTLPDYGWVRFRKDERAEPHLWQPQTVKALQVVTETARGAAAAGLTAIQAWNAFGTLAVESKPTVLRDLLEIRPAAAPLALDQVETAPTIVSRFIASAMSLGSLSPEAHQTITEAMNRLGGRSNTGEGGEDPVVYPEYPGAPAILNNKVKQVASARFGVTTEYLTHAEEIEIKIAQGSKPGEGGQLPSHKVTELIARLRHAQPGIALISPPPHHDIYSIEDLAQLIFDLKRVNPRAAIGVKLVSECGVGTVAAGVAKAYADYIVIAGHAGGTGASPLSSIKYAGNPWELGLAEAQQVLMQNGLRGRVRLRCDGGLRTGRDVLIAALLGADEFAFGTAVLVALGCDMARQCHLNTCPTGIATQRPDLRAKFRGKPANVIRFFEELTRDLQMLMASLGLPSLEAATGRTDLLEQVNAAGDLDLSALLAPPLEGHVRWQGQRNRRPSDHASIDNAWVQPALAARAAGLPYSVEATIANKHRTLGARLAGELVWHGLHHKDTPLNFKMQGVAGQSFGAFAVPGIPLLIEGMANDFVGK